MITEYIVATVFLLFSCHFLAGNGVAFMYARDFHINPFFLGSLRVFFSIPVLALIVFIFEGISFPKRKDMPLLFVTGVIGIFGAQLTFVLGNYFVGASYAALFFPLPTILTTIMGLFLKIEKINLKKFWGWCKFIGIFLAIIGTLVMVSFKAFSSLQQENILDIFIGNILMFVNVSTYSLYLVMIKYFMFSKKTPKSQEEHHLLEDEEQPKYKKVWNYIEENFMTLSDYPPMTLTLWFTCYSSLFYSAVDIIIFIIDPSILDLEPKAILPILYVSVIGSAFPLALIITSTKLTSPLYVSVFSIIQLPITVILAYLFFNQTLKTTDYIGGSFILLGLIIVIIGSFIEKRQKV